MIHVEVLVDQSTEAYLRIQRQFIAQRGSQTTGSHLREDD